jgi:hypothetical protein
MKADKRKQAESMLPPDLREVFDALIDDYQDAAFTHAGALWVNYKVLAELVLAGRQKNESASSTRDDPQGQ